MAHPARKKDEPQKRSGPASRNRKKVPEEMVKIPNKRVVMKVPIGILKKNKKQPRRYFDKDSLLLLAETLIERKDVDNPIRIMPDGTIVNGERRWRAAFLAGLDEVSVLVEPDIKDDLDLFKRSVRANFGEERMSLIEEAWAFQRIMEEEGWNQRQLAVFLAKVEPDVTNTLRLLNLIPEFQGLMMVKKMGPAVGFAISRFEHEHQNVMKEGLDDFSKSEGRALRANEISRIVRMIAEKKGIKPRMPKKGKKVSTYSELALRAVLRAMEKVEKEVKALRAQADENPKELKKVEKPRVDYVLEQLKGFHKDLGRAIGSLEKAIEV